MWFLALLGLAMAAEPQILAHRGYSVVAPENTMAAFEAAAAAGFGFELDVTLCASGEVIVIHDDTVDRTTAGSGAVNDLTLDQLAALDAGAWFGEGFAGEPLPTLREVLEAYGGRVPIDVEIKTMDPVAPLADAVVAEIERAGAVDQVFVSSFNPYMLARVREQNPDIRRGQLTATFKGEDLSFIQKLVLRKMWLNGRSAPDLVVVEDVRITPRRVRRWHRKGYEVWAWTVDDPERARELAEAGVDGLITNRPERLREALSGS